MSLAVHSQSYEEHLRSAEWDLLRNQVMVRAKVLCERCRWARAEEVHHRTYDRLGHERLEDLEALCLACHKKADAERAAAVAADRAAAQWEARVDGWCAKALGAGWEECYGWDYGEQEFETWLADRDDYE